MDNNEEKQDETFYDDYYGNNNDLDYKNDDESHNEEEKNVKEEKITNQSYYGRNIPQTKNKILLISFYIMMVIVLIIIYLLYRSNKYAFYLKKDEILLKNGSEYQVELLPKDLRYFDYLNYNYSIDNEKVATVDKYGTINTVGIGEAKLKISIKFGFGTKVMKIRSEDIKIDSIELKVDTDGKIEQKNKIGLYVDESITLRSFANKKDDFNINVSYTSSDVSIASVNEFGVVTAKKVGTAIISGTKDGVSGSIIVEVKKKETNTTPTKVKVDKVDIGITNTTMYVNDKLQLSAKVSPSNATGYTSKWTSNNNDIVEVSNNGLVTAKKRGTAVIKVVVDGKEASGTILVKEKQNTSPPTPQEIAVTGITINKTTTSIEVGKIDTLVATISPSNATNKLIAWSSSNSNVATVNNGVVTAKTVGTANITVTTANGKTATCVVTVKTPVPQEVAVTGVTLNKTNVSLEVGKTDTLVATISPSNATNKIIAWSSSNTSIATVDANGKITGKAAGTVTITAKTNNGKTAACKVTITKQEVAVTGINLNKTTASIDVGSTITLTATIAPTNATNKLIAWSSSNTSIATVDANGKVTGKNGGTVTITAKANNGKTATCKVTVKKENCVISLKEGNNESVANSNVENINNALQCAHRNNIKSLTVPKGNYYFNIAKKENNKYVLKPIYINFSNITLDLNGSTFNVYKNGSSSYVLFKIKNKDAGTATLKNGTLIGDRDVHICSDGSNMFCHDRMLRCYENEEYRSYESGHGVAISSTGVNVENLTIKNMMGDGIYVSFPYDISKNGMVNIQNNLIDSVRRNGISIIQGKNINIKSNVIRYTHGTWPQVGIDIERNNTTMFYENILIEGNTIYGNTGRRSVQLWAGIKGYMKIINNHLGDQVVGWDEAALQSAKGPKLERNLITIAGNDTKIPSGERDCVEDANTVTSHINRKCYDQIAEDDKCKK